MSSGQRSYVAEVLKAKIPRIDRDVVVALENGRLCVVRIESTDYAIRKINRIYYGG